MNIMNKFKKKEQPRKKESFVGGVLYVLIMNSIFLVLFDFLAYREFAQIVDWLKFFTKYAELSLLIWCMAYLFLYLLFRRHLIPTFLLSAFCVGFGTANYLKYQYRHEFIIPADMFIMNEWGTAFKSVPIFIPLKSVIAGAFLLLVCFFLWKKERKDKNDEKQEKEQKKNKLLPLIIRLVVFGCYCTLLVWLYKEHFSPYAKANYWGDYKTYVSSPRETVLYKHGVFLAFMEQTVPSSNVFTKRKVMNAYNELLKEDTSQVSTSIVRPNVIVIMSEALWDVNNLSDQVTFSQDPMLEYNKLIERYGGGTIGVNIFGGGTANTEFEMLTGYNVKNLKGGVIAYKKYFDKKQPSLVSYFEELGYDTLAIHPYKKTFYKRHVAYENLGFDEFISRDEMEHQELFDAYISDEALTNEIIDRYEKQSKDNKEPLFLFSVSMANHGTNMLDDDEIKEIQSKNHFEPMIDITYPDGEENFDMDRYVNGIYYSGKALKQLTDYFATVKEPTIIMMFGDHALASTKDFELPEVSLSGNEIDKTELSKYFTPVIMFNNYGLDKIDIQGANANYLSTILLKYSNLPLPNQAKMNDRLMQKMLSNTVYCIRDTNGNLQPKITKEQKFLDYRAMIIQYDMLNGSQYSKDLWSVPKAKEQ